jgi:hypothetical protein
LKSFKLDADSTAVASSVVDAAKEIELKRLELQKAALDAAQKKKDDKGGDSALRAVAGERAFAIYRVNGEQIAGLAKPTSKSYVDDKISLQAASGQAPAKNDTGITTDPTSLTVQTSVEDDEAYVITYLKRPLTDGDKAKLHFKTKSGQDKAVPADQLTVTDKGTILVKKDQLPDVVRVVLDQP